MNQRIPLAKVATIIRGLTHASDAFADSGPVFIGQSEVTQSGNVAPRFVKGGIDNLVKLEAGDIVIASMDQTQRVLVIGDQLVGSVLGHGCLAIRVEQSSSLASSAFLAAWMRTDDYRRQANTLFSGVTIARLGAKELGAIELPLLPQRRQEALVVLADQFQNARESLTVALAHVEQLERIELEIFFRENDQ